MTDGSASTQVQTGQRAPTVDPAKSNRLRRARAIFTCACDMPADERLMFVEDSCGGDLALVELVRSLLRADEGGVSAWDCAGVEVALISPVLSLPLGYEPIRELGRGGAGVVQLCRETESGELVAVKLVHVESSGRSAAARFRREWRLLARLRHPALVALRSAGTLDGGCAYLVMDFIDGQDIRKHCREQHLPAHRRLEMLVPIADPASRAMVDQALQLIPSLYANNRSDELAFGAAVMAGVHALVRPQREASPLHDERLAHRRR